MQINVNRQEKIIKNKFKAYSSSNDFSLFSSARRGVKPDLFYDLATIMKMSEKDLAHIIHVSARTVSNYKESEKTFDPVQSEHLLKLVALYEKGEELFGNIEEFNYWLRKPFWNNKEKPIDWLITPGGVDLVFNELTRMAYGDVV
jgi:putative toxin-antitoxin system antitoxin component (TIGR02293 family)